MGTSRLAGGASNTCHPAACGTARERRRNRPDAHVGTTALGPRQWWRGRFAWRLARSALAARQRGRERLDAHMGTIAFTARQWWRRRLDAGMAAECARVAASTCGARSCAAGLACAASGIPARLSARISAADGT